MSIQTTDYQRIHSEIGSRIRRRRQLIGLTQSQVAAALSVTFQQIHKYEAGQCNISCARLIQIAEILETTASEFIGSPPPSEFMGSPATSPSLDENDSLSADMDRLWADFSAIKSATARRSILLYLLQMTDGGGPANAPPGAAAPDTGLAEGSHR